MNAHKTTPFRFAVPLPAFVANPESMPILAGVHAMRSRGPTGSRKHRVDASPWPEPTSFGAYVALCFAQWSCVDSPGRANKHLQHRVLIGRPLPPIVAVRWR